MRQRTVQISSFFLLLAVVAVISALIVQPYLSAIILAVVLSVVFWPVHRDITTKLGGRDTLSALISTVLVVLVIILPLVFFGFLLFNEVTRLYESAAAGGLELFNFARWGEFLSGYIDNLSPELAETLRGQFTALEASSPIGTLLGWLASHLNAFFSGVFDAIVTLALAVLALFYLFKEGPSCISFIQRVSPLYNEHDRRIMNRITNAVNSVIRGRILTALIQGILSGVAFAIAGVPAPVLWAAIATVLSVIPLLGPGLVITPVAIYLFFTGAPWAAAGLIAWAYIAIYFIDDILGPIIIKHGGLHVHPFIILISILGGISVMGPVGFVAGPAVVAVLFVMLEIYPLIIEGRPAPNDLS